MISRLLLAIKDRLKSWPLYFLPHHLLSRAVFKATRSKTRLTQPTIRWFIRKFNVDMSDAIQEDITQFSTFNEFFTRELKPEARVIDSTSNGLICPVDGTISQIGHIEEGKIFQAKGHQFDSHTLLGGIAEHTKTFEQGRFTTIYLSPRDYHRIHMPCHGWLEEMIYIPGRLFSVAPHTVRTVPNLFARNERVVAIFKTETYRFAMILVGAINVAAIETVWHGLVTPPHKRDITRFNYPEYSIELNKGDEMGRFNMGSTVILLTENNFSWLDTLSADQPVRLGQALAEASGD